MMPACSPIDTIATALENLLSQFDESPNLRALLSLLVKPFQDIENDACALIETALLSNAVGALLDRYGLLVGVPRGGRNDTDYRRLISVRIAANLASGTIESIISVIAELAGAPVKSSPVYPAAYQLQVFTTSPLTAAQINDIADALADLTAAGVGYQVTEVASLTPFTFDVGPGFDAGEFARSIA